MTEKQQRFLTIFEQCFATTKAACKAAKISRSTFYEWLKQPEFKEAFEEIREGLIDEAEGGLHRLINGVKVASTDDENPVYIKPPDFRAIAFFLDRKARDRGYGERVQTDNTNHNTITVTIDYGNDE